MVHDRRQACKWQSLQPHSLLLVLEACTSWVSAGHIPLLPTSLPNKLSARDTPWSPSAMQDELCLDRPLLVTIFAGLEDAYPWPFWKTWFDSGAQSNSTPTGNLGALLLAGLAYGWAVRPEASPYALLIPTSRLHNNYHRYVCMCHRVQRRLIWRHVGNSLRMSRAEQGNKIQDTSHFIRAVGPG